MSKNYSKFPINSVTDAVPRKAWHAFGHRFHDLWIDGRRADYEVMNERAVRATAGLMMILAGIAFTLAYFEQIYLPIQVFTVLAALDFAIRLFSGLTTFSPFGKLGFWLVRKQAPEWVGAKQKRFAWSLGLIMASTVAYLVNTGQNGDLSATLCMICILLMWMEASLGICMGCKIYGGLIKLKITPQPENKPACPGGVCAVPVSDTDT